MWYILGSGSPRRKEILSMLLPEFSVIPSPFDEDGFDRSGLTAKETVCTLSRRKAETVFRMQLQRQPLKLELSEKSMDFCVIGGDTIVVSPDGEILGKPGSASDAARMLRLLSGKTHEVMTAVSIFSQLSGRTQERVFSVSTKVTFYPLSDGEIRDYIATGEPFDKAGGYGIQGLGGLLVEQIEGDYLNVVGLPAARLQRELRGLGLLPQPDGKWTERKE